MQSLNILKKLFADCGWKLAAVAFWLMVGGGRVLAQNADVGDQIESFFSDIESIMMAVATSAAVIGFIGLAIMNLGSSLPFLAEWKQENPKAARQVVTGLIILIFVGGGGLVGLLSFSEG